jgi:antirestriction protein ArdC
MTQVPAQQQERKNRFSISREVQTEFVASMAETISALTEQLKAGNKPAPAPQPFCPVTGFPYGGASMTRLMLESMKRGYSDDRWVTFGQLQKYKSEHKDYTPVIRKGEQGVKLLRAENVAFTVGENGKWTFLTEEQEKALRQNKGNGPQIQRKAIFYPYTVFNCSQIEGFPPKEKPAPGFSPVERDALLDKFIACSGVKVEHGHQQPTYDPSADVVKLPNPEQFPSNDAYQAMRLRLVFHATSHADREKRELGEDGKQEAIRGETFSMLAGARLGLPMPVDGGLWQREFQGAENRVAFEAAADAARMVTTLDQFARGEEPKAKWFPPKEKWAALMAASTPKDEQPQAASLVQTAPAATMRMR